MEELQPQLGVTAASIIHVRDGDSRRRTNTVILTFASPQPPKHITAGYLRVPVEPYIPNPLRCFNCQKYGHSSRACKSTALCMHCGESGHEAAHCKNQKKCVNCKGDHSASSRECPKWNLEKRVQQIKVERGISFPDARKAVLSEQSANTSSKRTAASVVSSATTITSKVTKKNTTSISIQTDLTWPEGTDSPVPVKHNGKSQSTQTYKKQDNTKPGNTTSPSPPPRASKAGTAPTPSTGKGGQGDPHPRPSTSTFPKKNAKRRINRPPPHTDDPIAMFSRYRVLDVEGGGGSDAE